MVIAEFNRHTFLGTDAIYYEGRRAQFFNKYQTTSAVRFNLTEIKIMFIFQKKQLLKTFLAFKYTELMIGRSSMSTVFGSISIYLHSYIIHSS